MLILRVVLLPMPSEKPAANKKRPHVVGPSGQVREDVVVPPLRAIGGPQP
jgi:hypothetical protein